MVPSPENYYFWKILHNSFRYKPLIIGGFPLFPVDEVAPMSVGAEPLFQETEARFRFVGRVRDCVAP